MLSDIKQLIPNKQEIEESKKVINEINKSKYKIYSSKELYSIFLEVIKGNNTYPKLATITKKQRPQLVEIMQPLIKIGIVEKKENTGFPGTPLEFILKEKPLIILLQTYIGNTGYTDTLSGWKKINEKLKDFIYSKNNLFSARDFEDLGKMAFGFAIQSRQEKIEIVFH